MAQKRKSRKDWIYRLLIIVLLVGAGVVMFLVWNNYFKDEKRDERDTGYVDEKETRRQAGDEKKEKDEAEEVVEGKKVEQFDGDDPNVATELSGVVTYAGVNGDLLMVRVNIDQYLDSGKCELRLMQNGNVTYSSEAGVASGPSTSSCMGFDVPVNDLKGNYEIIVKLNSGERTGVITGEVGV